MTTTMIFPSLYQVDSKGKVRIWFMETRDGKHRTHAGILNGNIVVSEWTQCEVKNPGKKNERSAAQQAVAEVDARYKKQLKRKYYQTIDEAQEAGTGKKFFAPMLAKDWYDYEETIPEDEVLYVQPKLDGIRSTLSKNGLLSREGEPFPACGHVLANLQPLFDQYPDIILDGELYNHDYKDNFNKLQSLITQKKPDNLSEYEKLEIALTVQYHVYDLPSVNAVFSERLRLLRTFVIESNTIKRVPTLKCCNREELDVHFAMCLEKKFEGQIIRRDTMYENKRTDALLKRKTFIDAEFPVSEVKEGKGNWAGCAKIVEIILPGDKRNKKGTRPEAGVRGDETYLKEVLRRSQAGDPPTFVTVQFQNYTPDGMLRFPTVKAFWWGKRDV